MSTLKNALAHILNRNETTPVIAFKPKAERVESINAPLIIERQGNELIKKDLTILKTADYIQSQIETLRIQNKKTGRELRIGGYDNETLRTRLLVNGKIIRAYGAILRQLNN